MAAPVVLMLDGDVGFMFALSQELTARDISAYPASTVREARSMLRRFRLAPDVLVIDCTVPGACSFAEGMAEQRRRAGILGIVSAGHQCEECAGLLAKTLHKLDDASPERNSPLCRCHSAGVAERVRPRWARKCDLGAPHPADVYMPHRL